MIVLMTVFNCYSFVVGLTSESTMLPALFFFLKIVLTIRGLWWGNKNLSVICSGPVENAMGILDKVWIESVLQGYNGHFPNTHSSNLWACISFHFLCLLQFLSSMAYVSSPWWNLFLSILFSLMQLSMGMFYLFILVGG